MTSTIANFYLFISSALYATSTVAVKSVDAQIVFIWVSNQKFKFMLHIVNDGGLNKPAISLSNTDIFGFWIIFNSFNGYLTPKISNFKKRRNAISEFTCKI